MRAFAHQNPCGRFLLTRQRLGLDPSRIFSYPLRHRRSKGIKFLLTLALQRTLHNVVIATILCF